MRVVPILLLVASLAFAATPANGQERRQTYLDAVFSRGEVLDYSLAWLRIVGGDARLSIRPAARTYRIESLAESNAFFSKFYPLRDQIISIVDRDTFSTLRYEKHLNERKKERHEVTVIDPVRGIAERKGERIAVKTPVYDPLSIIYLLRTMDLTPGKSHRLSVVADGKTYELDAPALRRETITTDAGTFRTVVVEPTMRKGGVFSGEDNKRLIIWFSDDERKIPVRIRSIISAGSITANLRSAKLGGEER